MPANATFKWDVPPQKAFGDMMRGATGRTHEIAQGALRARRKEVQDWMKAYAPWQDRTGNARRGLRARVATYPFSVQMQFYQGDPRVYYQVYLEYGFQGRYRIFAPTVDFWMPILMADIQRALNGRRG